MGSLSDEALDSFTSPIPICADESYLHRGELAAVLPRYDVINIKLDKTGGLTKVTKNIRPAVTVAGREYMGDADSELRRPVYVRLRLQRGD